MLQVYSSEWCANCKVLQNKLRNKRVSFKYINIDEMGLDEVLSLDIKSLPHVVISEGGVVKEVFRGTESLLNFDKIFGKFFEGEAVDV